MNSGQQINEDEQVIRRCLSGDPTAYRELYDRHNEVMYNVALRLHQNIQDAEDSLQEVFILYEVEGFSHQEIADMLQISVGTSKSQLHKAKRILRRRIEPFREILEVNG